MQQYKITYTYKCKCKNRLKTIKDFIEFSFENDIIVLRKGNVFKAYVLKEEKDSICHTKFYKIYPELIGKESLFTLNFKCNDEFRSKYMMYFNNITSIKKFEDTELKCIIESYLRFKNKDYIKLSLCLMNERELKIFV